MSYIVIHFTFPRTTFPRTTILKLVSAVLASTSTSYKKKKKSPLEGAKTKTHKNKPKDTLISKNTNEQMMIFFIILKLIYILNLIITCECCWFIKLYEVKEKDDWQRISIRNSTILYLVAATSLLYLIRISRRMYLQV